MAVRKSNNLVQMPTLCVQLHSCSTAELEEIKFFEDEEWTPGNELKIFSQLHELLSIAKPLAQSFHISISIETNYKEEIAFLLRKRTNPQAGIQTAKLSSREIEILGLIMQGLTNQEIADKLFISFETVKSHRKHILVKTGARNTAALIRHYHQTFFDK